MKISLKYKLLILLTVISCSSLASYALLALWDFKEDKLANIFNLNVIIADSVSRQINNQLQNHINALHGIAGQLLEKKSIQGGKTDNSATNSVLGLQANQYKTIWIYKWDKNRQSFYLADQKSSSSKNQKDSSASEPQTKNLENDEGLWVKAHIGKAKQRALETDVAIISNPQSEDWLLGIRYKDTESGKPILLIAHTQGSQFLNIDIGSAQNIYLLDDTGAVLANSNPLIYDLGAADIQDFLMSTKKQVGSFAGVAQLSTKEGIPWYASLARINYGQHFVMVALPENAALKPVYLLAAKSVVFFLIIASIAVALAVLGSNGLTVTLRQLRDAMVGAGQGNLDQNVHIKSKDEVGQLAGTFNKMTTQIKSLLSETVTLARMEEELKTAQLVQSTLFPKDQFNSDQLHIRGRYEPASECSGDWWSYQITKSSAFLWIGDATGHGVPAALVTSAARSATSILETLEGINLKSSMALLNQAIYRTTKGQVNMTFFAGQLNLETRELRFCNASHDPPLLLRRSGDQMSKKDIVAILGEGVGRRLGQEVNSRYEENTLQLQAGDRIIFYTDGLTELNGPDDKEFGERRFYKKIVEAYNETSEFDSFFDYLNTAIDEYRNNTPLNDDLTYYAIEIA
jgi:sigma-B regulation protein RsbU (phosphoserine phosphatase)